VGGSLHLYLSLLRILGTNPLAPTQPGVISHNEMLDLYIKHIDPEYSYKNFSVEEQAKILKAGRSNNELNCCKFMEAIDGECEVNEIHVACEKVFIRMKENLTKEGVYPDNLFKRK